MKGNMNSLLKAAAALLAATVLAVGCAPREAYYRPVDRRAVGRDGFVGVHHRVPPEAGNADGAAVVALRPLMRSRADDTKAEILAMIEFRNKRRETVTFLPGSVKLVSGKLGSFAPREILRKDRPAGDEEQIAHWHRAAFLVRWELPAEEALAEKSWTLSWEYRYGGRGYPQRTAFAACGPELARRSLSGGALVEETGSSSASGVPFLMNVPFVGVLFRSGSSSSRSNTITDFGPPEPGRVPGAWWPLEPGK